MAEGKTTGLFKREGTYRALDVRVRFSVPRSRGLTGGGKKKREEKPLKRAINLPHCT